MLNALYRLDPRVPAASLSPAGKYSVQGILRQVESVPWGEIDGKQVRRWAGHADDRVAIAVLEAIYASPEAQRRDWFQGIMREVADRAQAAATADHVMWAPLIDRVAMFEDGRRYITDFADRLSAIQDWIRNGAPVPQVMGLLDFKCEQVGLMALRQVRRLEPSIIPQLERNPRWLLILVRENFYLTAEDTAVLWPWLESRWMDGDMPAGRAVAELVARRMVNRGRVREVMLDLWARATEATAPVIMPTTLAGQWRLEPAERDRIIAGIARAGLIDLAIEAIEAHLVQTTEQALELARAFPRPSFARRLQEAVPKLVEQVEAIELLATAQDDSGQVEGLAADL
jgi:hypothetical protein